MNVKLNNMMAVGGCLCESVSFEVEIALSRCNLSQPMHESEDTAFLDNKDVLKYPSSPSQICVCSCSMCRKASGAACLPFAAFSRDKITFHDQSTLKTYHSSDIVKRGFCGKCGAQVYMDYGEKHSLWLTLGLIKNLEDVLNKVSDHKEGIMSLSKITYPGCHVFAESRDEALNHIMNLLPDKKGFGLYVQDPCEPLIKPFTEKKPQGASSHEELKDMMKSDDLGIYE